MKNIYKQFSWLFVIVFIHSCTSTEKSTVAFTDQSLPLDKLDKSRSVNIEDTFLINPVSIEYHPKGYLIFLDSQSDYLVKILNINTGTVQKIVRKGRGPNECIHISKISVVNNDVWLHEPALRKMLRLKIDTLGFFGITEELNMGIQAGKFVALTNDLFVGTPFTRDRVAYFNRKGDLICKAGGFPKNINHSEGDGILPNVVFQTKITASPDGKYVALANLDVDVLEIYSDKGDIICLLSGPDGIETTVKPRNTGVGSTFPLDPLFFTYRDIKALPNEIWASYAGIEIKKGEMPDEIFPNKIYCFSWHGKPIRKIELDHRILSFVVDSKNMKLYCLVNTPSIKVIEYDISGIKI